MEANMQVLEGAQYRLRVKLTNEAGEQLPPENFRVYGGAFCPGFAPAHFHAERTGEEWILTMPGLKPGRVPWNWQVIAAEYATGVEWLLAAGEVNVTPRHATGSAAVDPGELHVLATLDKSTLKMTVQLGESTAACSLAVIDARNSAAEANAAANRSARSAELADSYMSGALDAKADAEGAADLAGESATKADGHAVAAADSAAAAATEAENARAAAGVADGHAAAAAASQKAAGERAADAAASSKAAADAASTAMAAAETATQQASSAESSAVAAAGSESAAAGSATAAAGSAQAADASAERASEHAAEAAGCAIDAQQAQQDAADSAATAASTLNASAKKAENNTFTGTNTFNGAILANGGINGLEAPTGWGSAVSLLGARFGAFVGECLQRRISTSFSVKSGNGTLASNRLTVADGEQALAYSPLAWKIIPANYSTLGALWVPLRKGSTVAKGKCRVCVNLCCSLRNYTEQAETMEKPIFSYTEGRVYTYAHYNVIEFSIEYGPQGQQVVTLLSPIVNENMEMTGMREQCAVVSANNLGGNHIGLLGFLIVRTATNAYEVFAVSEDGSCKIYKCGSVWAKSALYTAEGTTQKLYIGVSEGSWYLPAELIMEASLPSGVYASMAAQVAQATGTPTVTDYTFEEFNAKYGIE